MARPLTTAQEKIRDNQIEKNVEYLRKIDELSKEMESFHQLTIQLNNNVVNLYETLDKAHGMLIQGEYANIYTVNLKPPVGPVFEGLSFTISHEFDFLSTKKQQELLSSLISISDYLAEYNRYYKPVKELLSDIHAENSIIVRFEGMEELYLELKKLCEKYWTYPIRLAQETILNNRTFINPITLHGMNHQHPFHIQLYLDYMPHVNSGRLLKAKLDNIKPIIKSINAQLPFAELADKVPLIQNNVTGTDLSTMIGEHASIGENNAIGENAIVKGE